MTGYEKELICKKFTDNIELKRRMMEDDVIIDGIQRLAGSICACLRGGGKVVLCGNGGSASDALHFAAEIVGRFQKEREAWPAMALNADVASMTSIANDYGYEYVFSRQAEAFLTKKDICIGISTSGNSENVYQALCAAERKGAKVAALLGKDGGKIRKLAEDSIVVPSGVTARVQECHILIIHIICELVEEEMGK